MPSSPLLPFPRRIIRRERNFIRFHEKMMRDQRRRAGFRKILQRKPAAPGGRRSPFRPDSPLPCRQMRPESPMNSAQDGHTVAASRYPAASHRLRATHLCWCARGMGAPSGHCVKSSGHRRCADLHRCTHIAYIQMVSCNSHRCLRGRDVGAGLAWGSLRTGLRV